MKTKDEVLRNLQNINSDEVDNYVDRLTECLFRKRVTNWSLPIGCGLTDYNKMLAQSIVSKLQAMGYYAKYGEISSPWRYYVTISTHQPRNMQQRNIKLLLMQPLKWLFGY